MRNLICQVILVIASSLVAALTSCSSSDTKSVSATPVEEAPDLQADLLNRGVKNVFEWEHAEGELLCLSRITLSPESKLETNLFEIYNEDGKVIYSYELGKLGRVKRIYTVYALRNSRSQLAVETSGEGSLNFLSLLDYDDGMIVELIDTNQSEFSISSEIKPVFRGSKFVTDVPFEIYLTTQLGLGVEPSTQKFVFIDGKYVPAESF